jgi:tripartite-type tricarboxylate transporter receptor subunit TctC
MKRRLFCLAGLSPALLRAQGSPWPQAKAIRMLVGQPAGYGPDISTRQLAEVLSAELKQTIVVENKPGGGGALMMRALRDAAPDGYTLGSVFWNQMTVAPALIKQIDYNPAEDFAHVGIWTTGAQLLVAHPRSGFRQVKEVMERAKASKPPISWASHGSGSPGHVFMSLLLERAGMAMNHVPFPGSQAVTAAVSGDVPIAITGVADSLGFVNSGQLVALAVTGGRRLPILPAVPTLTEAGYPGVEYGVWAGLLAPKGTSDELILRLNAALRAAASRPALREKREAAGAIIELSSPQEMQRQVREELPLWRSLVQRVGIIAS